MTEGGTLQALMDFIRQEGDIPGDDPDFGQDIDLFDFGYVDSFGLVRLIEWVSERFGVDIGNADFYADLRTAAGIAAHIDARRAA